MATKNNNKTYRKIKLLNLESVSPESAKEFIDHRINLKKPLTQLAFERAMKAANRCESLGIQADNAVEITIDMGWQGIVFSYIQNELKKRAYHETNQRSYQQRETRSTRADKQLLRVVSR